MPRTDGAPPLTPTLPIPAVPTQRRGARKSAPDESLGSILKRPVPEEASVADAQLGSARAVCGNCAGVDTNELRILLADGSTVTFVTCHDCTCTGWFAAAGAPLTLDVVLARASTRRR